MPRNRPLDKEWRELDSAVETYFLLIAHTKADSVEGRGGLATVMSAVNNAIDHAAVRAQGKECPELNAMRSIKQQLEKEHSRLDDPHVREAIKERLRREQQWCRRDTHYPA